MDLKHNNLIIILGDECECIYLVLLGAKLMPKAIVVTYVAYFLHTSGILFIKPTAYLAFGLKRILRLLHSLLVSVFPLANKT